MRHPKRKCQHCKETAIYGYTTPLTCAQHRAGDMLNLVEQLCAQCSLMEVLDADGLCGCCSPTMWRTVRLAKQKMVREWLNTWGLEYDLTDRMLPEQHACDFRGRPDFLWERAGWAVVLEVDERGHAGYLCEEARMVNMTATIGMPTVFVRMNPDTYKPGGSKQASTTERMKVLRKVLEHHLAAFQPSDAEANPTGTWAVWLFYDGYTTADQARVLPVAVKAVLG
jgi:hypothetical protein